MKAVAKAITEAILKNATSIKKSATSVKDAIAPSAKEYLEGVTPDTATKISKAGKTQEFINKWKEIEVNLDGVPADTWAGTYEKSAQSIAKFSEKVRSGDASAIAIAKKMAQNVGIDGDIFEKTITAQGAEQATLQYKTHLKMLSVESRLKQNIDMASGLVDEPVINKILLGTESLAVKADKVKKATQLAQDMVIEMGGFNDKRGGFGGLVKWGITDLNSKISEAAYKAYDNGYSYVGGTLERLYKLNKARRTFDDASEAIHVGSAKKWQAIDAANPKKADALREYVENYDRSNAEQIANGGMRAIEADQKTMQSIAAKYQIEFTPEDIAIANKTINMNRASLKTKLDFQEGDYRMKDFYTSWEEIPENIITHKNQLGFGDYGPNFFHAVPTKEYFQEILKKDSKIAGYIKGFGEDQYKYASFFQEMRKEGVSGLRLNNANRLRPHEEIMHYGRTYSKYMVKRTGDNLLDQAYLAMHLPFEKQGNTRVDVAWVNDVKSQWNKQMSPARRKRTMPDGTVIEEGGIFGMMDSFGEIAIPLMLNPVTGSKAIALNLVQLPIVAGSFKGYANTIKETLSATSGFVSNVLLNEGNLKKTFNSMVSKKKGLDKELFERYIRDNPMLFSMGEDHAMLAEKGTKTRAFTDFITYFFQASDKISRFAGFGAAVNHGEANYRIFMKDIASGMEKSKAVGKLAQNLHLREFNKVDIKELIETLNTSNPSKSMKEFIYKYAESSTYAELFDYSRVGNAGLKDALAAGHPLLTKFMAFRTWPLYFNTLVKGSIESYKYGDKAPLLTMAGVGAASYTALEYVQGQLEQDSYAQKLAQTASSRAPFVSYLSLASLPTEPSTGVMTPIAALPMYATAMFMNKASEVMNDGGDPSNWIDYYKRTATKHVKSALYYRMMEDIGIKTGLYGEDE